MKRYWSLLFVSFFVSFTFAQKLEKGTNYHIVVVGFWNVENLYDTIDDPKKDDQEFLPNGTNLWNTSRYLRKLDHLAEVIKQMGEEFTPDGPAVLGMCEIENINVLKDLAKQEKIANRNYQAILIEGPDARGVDPALMYNPKYFKPEKSVSYHVKLVTDSAHKTRDILVVYGKLLGEPFAFLVNHWPSRRGGEEASRPNRIAAAKIARHIADSITASNPNIKIMIMGDYNDDPINESIKKYIRTYDDLKRTRDDEFFNPMEKLYKKGIGTLAYQDQWNLFDQILINKPLLPSDYSTLQYFDVKIFNKPFVRNDFGNFRGYPFRTIVGGNYQGGYSDHFAVYVGLARKVKK
ncbi:MAG: endonuclease/exonuclease/phosphatase family protein [Bacteroidia bacterium]|nr:endonuclease/exonuclease/phosphatase family protein [Bacteroidia bacterium]